MYGTLDVIFLKNINTFYETQKHMVFNTVQNPMWRNPVAAI